MPTHVPINLRTGAILQGGIPKEPATPPGPNHSLVRAIVTATYCVDDPQHPLALAGQTPAAVVCDCLVFGTASGASRFFFLPGVQVMQPFGGIHTGAIYKPRATTRLVSGRPLSSATPSDVSDMDGDVVLVMMLDGRSNSAVIIGHLPHPSRDVGNPAKLPIGQRQQLRLVDGQPMLWAHHGTAYGIADSGDFVIDTQRATQNGIAPNSGDAPGSPGNGSCVWSLAGAAARSTTFYSAGEAILQEVLTASGFKLDSKLAPLSYQLTSAAGNALRVSGASATARVQVGDGSAHAAISEQIQALWAQFSVWASTHTHVVQGPLANPTLLPPPPFNTAIASSALTIPST